jgi:hypothetical protein
VTGEYYDMGIRSFEDGTIDGRTLVIAYEELEGDADSVYRRITSSMHLHPYQQVHLGTLGRTRYNAQYEVDMKGVDTASFDDSASSMASSDRGKDTNPGHVPRDSGYVPGVYAISGHQKVLANTRELLNICWRRDCEKMRRRTGYSFSACSGV